MSSPDLRLLTRCIGVCESAKTCQDSTQLTCRLFWQGDVENRLAHESSDKSAQFGQSSRVRFSRGTAQKTGTGWADFRHANGRRLNPFCPGTLRSASSFAGVDVLSRKRKAEIAAT